MKAIATQALSAIRA